MNDDQRRVLDVLRATDDRYHEWGDDYFCLSFRAIGGERKATRRACRALARKGLTAFHNGLFNDDGEVAGAGYCITKAGREWLEANPLD